MSETTTTTLGEEETMKLRCLINPEFDKNKPFYKYPPASRQTMMVTGSLGKDGRGQPPNESNKDNL